MALDGDKDAALFILTKYPSMPQRMKDLIWGAANLKKRGRKISEKSDLSWLTIEIAKFSGRSIQQGIQDYAVLFDMDEESIKKAWDRARKVNEKMNKDFGSQLISNALRNKLARE